MPNKDLYIPQKTDSSYLDYCQQILKTISRKKWNVRIESPILGSRQIIEYLGRYIKRVAITNSRIQDITATQVNLVYKQYARQQKGQAAPSAIMHFEGTAFIHRFVQHILPPYFQRVRYFGLYAWAAKRKKDIAYQLLTKQTPTPYEQPLKRQLLKKMLGTDPDVCPDCGAYQTLNVKPLVATEKYYFKLKAKWHNVHIKLRQDETNLTT